MFTRGIQSILQPVRTVGAQRARNDHRCTCFSARLDCHVSEYRSRKEKSKGKEQAGMSGLKLVIEGREHASGARSFT